MPTDAESSANVFSSPQLWGQMGSAVMSGATGLIGQALQYKYNKRLLNLQNKYNIDMWKMQADYNSPQSQMQRFQEAGLNPNLIYSQGSNGNMSQAPVQGVPEAPNFTPAMQKMAEAFNIENLRTIIANRKKAEAEAKDSQVKARTASDIYEGMTALGNTLEYNPKTGQFGFTTPYQIYSNQGILPGIGFYHAMRTIADNFRGTTLLQPRAQLLNAQYRYLQPQIIMSNYEARHQPTTYWIGQGTKILGSLPLPKLNWSFQNKTFNKSY